MKVPTTAKRHGFLVALDSVVGWLRRTFRRPQYVIGVDFGLDGAETTCKTLLHQNGTIEVLEIIETKPANTEDHASATERSR
jgi:hypothetical protein